MTTTQGHVGRTRQIKSGWFCLIVCELYRFHRRKGYVLVASCCRCCCSCCRRCFFASVLFIASDEKLVAAAAAATLYTYLASSCCSSSNALHVPGTRSYITDVPGTRY